MDLQYLDGLHGTGMGERGDDLVFEGNDDTEGTLGKGFFKKLVSKINKINPVTVVLRNGFLAAMKLNLFKVASRIKYAYLSPEEATTQRKRTHQPPRMTFIHGICPLQTYCNLKISPLFSSGDSTPKNIKSKSKEFEIRNEDEQQ
jgi:hypothetical protein